MAEDDDDIERLEQLYGYKNDETSNNISSILEDEPLRSPRLPPPASFPSPPMSPSHNGSDHRRSQRRSGMKSIRSISNQAQQQNGGALANADFAVQSIRRGTQEWRTLVKAFVADLAFYSLKARQFATPSRPLFRPYTCHNAAVMFVDISGYSKIASALAYNKGAHALSTAVNSYLSRLLRIVVQQHGGDVVKFCGDAVLCVWHAMASKQKTAEQLLERNVLCAAQCALQLQKQAGSHPVQIEDNTETQHEFKIHIGLSCGTVESEIFSAPQHSHHMQRLYHLLGGTAVEEVGPLVDLAKAGQVCVCGRVLKVLNDYAPQTIDIDDYTDSKLLTDLRRLNNNEESIVEAHIEQVMMDRLQQRDLSIEEDFIHPSVLDLLSHGGLSPTQIAQMRDLVVLFIAQTARASPVNWLLEVQAVLDRYQCPLLQIVADDKGVHAIAAVNAVNAVPESRLLGLEICRELVHRKIGVAIGMAAGSTFCGVTGSSSIACRWDITGGPPVRSARLMQYALRNDMELAIDESVYVGSTVPARMTLLRDDVPIKGSPKPIRVFGLSEATEFAAMNLLETVHGEMHNDQVQQITECLTGGRNRSAVVVTGPTLAGKKIVCQRAAGYAGMVPFLHVSDDSYGLLQLARTIATWFKYVPNEQVRSKACAVKGHLDNKLLSLAHDECIMLVDLAIESGLVSCFIVDRVEFLDPYSFSLMRECLHGRYRKSRSAVLRHRSGSILGQEHAGRIAFLCVHVPFYNWPSAESVVEDITRSHKNLTVPIIEVAQATLQQFRDLAKSMTSAQDFRSDALFDDRLLYAASAAAGHCAGYFFERAAAVSQMQPGRVASGKQLLVQMTEDLVYRIPKGGLREYRTVPVMQVGSEIAMRFAHVYDELPPIMQVFCKVLAIVGQTGFWWAPRARLWEVLNDLIAEGVEDDVMSKIIEEMAELYLIRIWEEDGEKFVKFQSPALVDVALDVCTPIQVQSTASAWIERLEPDTSDEDFRTPLVLAWLYVLKNKNLDKAKEFWRRGYDTVLRVSEKESWPISRVDRWKELIAGEIEAGGANVLDTLPADFSYGGLTMKSADFSFYGTWMYRGPIALGPLGNTLSVLTEQIFSELILFADGCCLEAKELSAAYYKSASMRYIVEARIIEELLAKHDLGMEHAKLHAEEDFVRRLAIPALNKEGVFKKGQDIFEKFVPRFVEPRLKRLRLLTTKLNAGPVPEFVSELECNSIRMAYGVMFEDWGCKCQTESNDVNSAQHALMVLATLDWKPRPVPENLRHLAHQTVARLRNAVVRRLNYGQLHFMKHQQSAVDLKAFLLTTALLFHAEDEGRTKEDLDALSS